MSTVLPQGDVLSLLGVVQQQQAAFYAQSQQQLAKILTAVATQSADAIIDSAAPPAEEAALQTDVSSSTKPEEAPEVASPADSPERVEDALSNDLGIAVNDSPLPHPAANSPANNNSPATFTPQQPIAEELSPAEAPVLLEASTSLEVDEVDDEMYNMVHKR